MKDLQTFLKKVKSHQTSGILTGENAIPLLKEKHYYVQMKSLIGDAPKEFITAYFYEEDSTVRKLHIKSWHSFIAKTGEKWYPHESVTEFMINRIGEELGLLMNEIKLVRANSQIRFLSKYFLKKNEKLVHGAEICGEYLEDRKFADEIAKNKNEARQLFTFEFVEKAVKSIYPHSYQSIMNGLVKMTIFDAITGNNDRHFYNWGVIDTIKKKSQLPTFAPIFDSARGLLWNESDEKVKHHLNHFSKDGRKIVNYLEAACPRISMENNRNANHFEFVKFIKEVDPQYKNYIKEMSSEVNELKVLNMLKKEFYPFFISERQQAITIIINNRFKKIRNIYAENI
jgi:HipA-like C-terminal domain